jgi:flagellar secretion chaperone FliS
MTESRNKALGQYRTVNAYGAAEAGDRLQLISRLLQGTIDRIVTARGHMIRREVAAKGENLSRAVSMIEGLRVSLDHNQGGEISRNLEALYDYMTRRLTEGNLRNDPGLLDEVVELLVEIRSGWDEMSRTMSTRPGDALPPVRAVVAQSPA